LTSSGSSDSEQLLKVEDLVVNFASRRGTIYAVNGISFDIRKNEIFGLVGESGSGKSVTALSLVKLLPNNARFFGSAKFKGNEIFSLPHKELNRIRRKNIAIVFQDPFAYLNPVLKIESQMKELLEDRDSRSRITEVFQSVGLPDADHVMRSFPNQLSGGMSQRVVIAMALIRNPDLIIADEITTALDVTIQAQILGLLNKIRKEYGLSVLFITHDLSLVAQLCDRVAVMYAGNIVEQADVGTLFADPKHPYTQGLLKAVPRVDDPTSKLVGIPGTVSDLSERPRNCSFYPRCVFAFEKCWKESPLLAPVAGGHSVACYLYGVPSRAMPDSS
jgi:oligopeptide/dipeptide ABC transporter ATP-binding protein